MSTPAVPQDRYASLKSSAGSIKARVWVAGGAGLACFTVFLGYAFLAPARYEARALVLVTVPSASQPELTPAQAKSRLLALLLNPNVGSKLTPKFTPPPRELLNRLASSLEIETLDARRFQITLGNAEATAAADECNQVATYAAARVVELFAASAHAEVEQAAVLPTEPTWPNRPLLLLVGAAMGAFVAALTLLAKPKVRRPNVGSAPPSGRESSSEPPPVSVRKSVRIPVAAEREVDLPSPSASLGNEQLTPAPSADKVPVHPASERPASAHPASARTHRPPRRTQTQAFGAPVLPQGPDRVSERTQAPPKVVLFRASWKPNPGIEPDLRAQLCDQILVEPASGCTVIGVTSALEFAHEKSQVSLEIALILANIGEPRILLVEGNFMGAKVHQLLNIEVPWAAGFSQQLQAREAQGDEAWCLAECLPTLHVLAEGALRSPGAMLSHQFERCLRKLRPSYDFIVIDGPPLSAEVDCQALNEVTDGLVLVTRAGDERGRFDDRRTSKFSGKRFVFEEDF